MSVVKEVTDQSNKHSGWAIHCPECCCSHIFDDRWEFNGDMEKPTFSPSMLVNGHDPEERCHSFVTDGKIRFLDDCGTEHELRGQTVDLPNQKSLFSEENLVNCSDCSKSELCKHKKRSSAIIGCYKGKS